MELLINLKGQIELNDPPNSAGRIGVIFLVYPLWWNKLPMPVEGFLKQLIGKERHCSPS